MKTRNSRQRRLLLIDQLETRRLLDGQALFGSAVSLPGVAPNFDVDLADLDGDHDLDAFITSDSGEGNRVWFNDGDGSLTDSGQRLGNADSIYASLGDLDSDHDLDAFVATRNGSRVWLNNGSGVFFQWGQILGNSLSIDVALGDLDGDGDLDAFVANTNGVPDRVYVNDGSGTFTDSGQLLGATHSKSVVLGDLDKDGDLDAFVGNGPNNGVEPDYVWLNNGKGVFTDSTQRLGNSQSQHAALGDLDGDGDLEAFAVGGSPAQIWLNNGQGGFSDTGQSLGISGAGSHAALGDLDNDGDLDAFIANWFQEPDTVWLNNGIAVFSDSGLRLGTSTSSHVAFGDLDSDGDLDAVVANYGEANHVYFNLLEPRDANRAANEVVEQSQPGIPVGITAFADFGNGQVVSYFLTDDSGERFAIDSSTGVVSVKNGSLLDAADSHLITVTATTADGSSKSNRFEIKVLPLPLPLVNVVATDNEFTDRVRLNWNAVAGASAYQIWRGIDASVAKAELLLTVANETSLDDFSAAPGVTYRYWVRPTKPDVIGTFGNPDEGQRIAIRPDVGLASGVSIVYDPSTGALTLETDTKLSALSIQSTSGILPGPDPRNLLIREREGFGNLSLGRITVGLSQEMLANDLTIFGSLANGTRVTKVDLVYVPNYSVDALFVYRQETGEAAIDGHVAITAFETKSTPAQVTSYTVVDVGTLGGGTLGMGINSSGHVTGFSATHPDPMIYDTEHAFLYDGTIHDLGTFPGGRRSHGLGINASGQVAGWAHTSEEFRRAVLFDGTLRDLGTLGGRESAATDINDSGQIVGVADDHAFLYDGVMRDLGTLRGGYSIAMGISETGQVTGESDSHAFLYDGTMHDLGTLGGDRSVGEDIRTQGYVVGWSQISRGNVVAHHAFLYDGTMHDLGTLGGTSSKALGINASGQVTGHSQTKDGAQRAFIYDRSRGMVDLNSLIDPKSGWILRGGNAINDNGQITGGGSNNGAPRTFILNPVERSIGSVFDGERPAAVDAWFEVYRPEKLFVLEPFGFEDLDLGRAVKPGIEATALSANLSFDGSKLPSGEISVSIVHISPLSILPNRPPIAEDDLGFETAANQILSIDPQQLLSNDLDEDGDLLAVSNSDTASLQEARITRAPDGSLIYDPRTSDLLKSLPPGLTINDQFRYDVSDGREGVDTARVTIRVTGVNDPPEATQDALTLSENDEPSDITSVLMANDRDVDFGDAFTITGIDVNGTVGIVTLNNGRVTYQPGTGFDGLKIGETATDTFTYTITDRDGETSTSTAVITVIGESDLPGDVDGDGLINHADVNLLCSSIQGGGRERRFDLDGNGAISLADLDTLIRSILKTTYGDANLDRVFNSSDFIQIFQAGEYNDNIEDNSRWETGDWNCDREFDTADLIVAFQAGGFEGFARLATMAQDDKGFGTTADQTLLISAQGLIGNDSDDEGNVLFVSEVEITTVQGARVTLNSNGSVLYDPTNAASLKALPPQLAINDWFRYTISDGRGGTDSANAIIRVTGVNDPPSAGDLDLQLSENADSLDVTALLQSHTTEIDFGDTSTITRIDTSGTIGTVIFEAGKIAYRPGASFDWVKIGETATDRFVYEISDNYGGKATATVRILVTGEADALGDLDGDGLINSLDISLLCARIHGSGQPGFEPRFDLDGNNTISLADLDTLITRILRTTYGDANLDGRFNSSDLVQIFQAGQYSDRNEDNSTWTTGDWNCDREFDSSDLIVAFQSGGFEQAASS